MTPPHGSNAVRADEAFDELDRQNDVLDTGQGDEAPEPSLHAVRDTEELETEQVDSDLSAELEAARQEQAQRRAHAAGGQSGGGKLLGGTALLVALMAAGGAGATYMQGQQFRSDVAVAFEEVDSNIAAAGQRMNEIQLALQEVSTKATENRVHIAGIDTQSLQTQISMVQRDLESATAALTTQSGLAARESQTLRQQISDVEASLTVRMSELVAKPAAGTPAPVAPKPVAKAVVKPKPTGPKIANSLDGAAFVNVDTWGFEQHAVMAKGGEYTYLAVGDAMGEWTLKSIDTEKNRAVFSNGSRSLTVKQN